METVEIPEQFIKDLYNWLIPGGQAVIKKHFPQLFVEEVQLVPGVYRDDREVTHILFKDKEGDWRLVNNKGFLSPSGNEMYFRKDDYNHITILRIIMSKLKRVK